MRCLLLLAVMSFCAALAGQSTLRIYVVNDDNRSDMAIIDLNTESIDRYGQSVDSTNINFYATTMSTQVMRLTYEELYGFPKDIPIEGAEMRTEIIEPKIQYPITSDVMEVQAHQEENISLAPSNPVSAPIISGGSLVKNVQRSNASGGGSYRSSDRKPSKKISRGGGKKTRKYKKYNGRCPKFF